MALLEAMALGSRPWRRPSAGSRKSSRTASTGCWSSRAARARLPTRASSWPRRRPWAARLGAPRRRLTVESAVLARAQRPGARQRSIRTSPRRPTQRRGGRRRRGDCSRRRSRVFASRVRRKVEHVIERRRAERLREDPAPNRRGAARRQSVLVVCHGNIIRSPFAARLIDRPAASARGDRDRSAGLTAEPGRPSHPLAIETAAPLRVDLSDHAAARLTPDDVARADAIFVMDVDQRLAVRRLHPSARAEDLPARVARAGHAARSARSDRRRRVRVPGMLRAHHPRGPAAGPASSRRTAMKRHAKTALGHWPSPPRLDALLLRRRGGRRRVSSRAGRRGPRTACRSAATVRAALPLLQAALRRRAARAIWSRGSSGRAGRSAARDHVRRWLPRQLRERRAGARGAVAAGDVLRRQPVDRQRRRGRGGTASRACAIRG